MMISRRMFTARETQSIVKMIEDAVKELQPLIGGKSHKG